MGPVLGSLLVSLVATGTLPSFNTWQSQYVICGIAGLAMFVVAALGLRELSPRLRSQLMVSEQDRVLIEARAKGFDLAESVRNPWRQVLKLDVVASALGVSVMLLIYYTEVGFFTIFAVSIFGFDLVQANALANWMWVSNAVALLVGGIWSDRLGVRKPFMLFGGVAGATVLVVFLQQAGERPSFAVLAFLASLLSAVMGLGYSSWMASFTETVEAHNPALTGTGLAVWGWLIRLVVTVAFLAIPHVVGDIESPTQWQSWFWICVAGIVAFVLVIPLMKGRWSPKAARADQEAHNRAVAAALLELAEDTKRPT